MTTSTRGRVRALRRHHQCAMLDVCRRVLGAKLEPCRAAVVLAYIGEHVVVTLGCPDRTDYRTGQVPLSVFSAPRRRVPVGDICPVWQHRPPRRRAIILRRLRLWAQKTSLHGQNCPSGEHQGQNKISQYGRSCTSQVALLAEVACAFASRGVEPSLCSRSLGRRGRPRGHGDRLPRGRRVAARSVALHGFLGGLPAGFDALADGGPCVAGVSSPGEE